MLLIVVFLPLLTTRNIQCHKFIQFCPRSDIFCPRCDILLYILPIYICEARIENTIISQPPFRQHAVYDASVYNASLYNASVYDASVHDASLHDMSVSAGWRVTGYFCGSHGLSARRARRTKSRGYSRPRQTMADQSILKSAVLPASPMPLLTDN